MIPIVIMSYDELDMIANISHYIPVMHVLKTSALITMVVAWVMVYYGYYVSYDEFRYDY